jgi:transcriptional regulator with XRE-family HTH domain
MVSNFEDRRLEFAYRLRRAREEAGLKGVELAAALKWKQPKVSKIECGRQTPTDADVLAWLQVAGASSSTIEQMRRQLLDLQVEQITWRGQLRHGHRTRQELALRNTPSVISRRGVAVTIVPGLLQTEDYARAIFRTQMSLLEVPNDVEAAVVTRMARQRILYDPSERIEVLIAESALLHSVCARDVLLGQLDHLISIIGLPSIRLGVLPVGLRLPYIVPHGFWILDSVVLVETVSEELRVVDPDQVSIYARLVDRLWAEAIEGDQAQALLIRAVASFNRSNS